MKTTSRELGKGCRINKNRRVIDGTIVGISQDGYIVEATEDYYNEFHLVPAGTPEYVKWTEIRCINA